MFSLDITKLYWIEGSEDDSRDLCIIMDGEHNGLFI